MNRAFSFSWDATTLTVQWPDEKPVRFPAAWLFDQCWDGRGWSHRQRRIDIYDLPEDPRIECVSRDFESLNFRWAGEAEPTPVEVKWLQSIVRRAPCLKPLLWDCRAETLPLRWAEYDSVVTNPEYRADWLEGLLVEGIAFLRGVPLAEGAVLRAAGVIGYPVETNYGRVFQVRPEPAPENLAYTELGLGLHTDNPYREPVPGYQLLHCLIAGGDGGESVFADGFAVAEALRREDQVAFRTLAAVPVEFRYRDATTDLEARRTIIELDRDGNNFRIHWNSRSLSTARLPLDNVKEFYPAYRVFAGMLRGPRFARRVKLNPGELVAFDNGRVLHGRSAFTGERLLEGCYVSREGAASNLAVLRRG